MTRKQRRLVLIGSSLVVLAFAVALVLTAMRDSIVFFNSPTDVVEKKVQAGTRIRLGEHAEVEITGLRNPCKQINGFQPGLMKRLVSRGDDGEVVRLAGVMAIVLSDGVVRAGDALSVTLPEGEHVALQPV